LHGSFSIKTFNGSTSAFVQPESTWEKDHVEQSWRSYSQEIFPEFGTSPSRERLTPENHTPSPSPSLASFEYRADRLPVREYKKIPSSLSIGSDMKEGKLTKSTSISSETSSFHSGDEFTPEIKDSFLPEHSPLPIPEPFLHHLESYHPSQPTLSRKDVEDLFVEDEKEFSRKKFSKIDPADLSIDRCFLDWSQVGLDKTSYQTIDLWNYSENSGTLSLSVISDDGRLSFVLFLTLLSFRLTEFAQPIV